MFIAVVPFRSQTMLIGLPSGAQKWSTAREMPWKARSPTALATTLVPKLIDTIPAAPISDPTSAAG